MIPREQIQYLQNIGKFLKDRSPYGSVFGFRGGRRKRLITHIKSVIDRGDGVEAGNFLMEWKRYKDEKRNINQFIDEYDIRDNRERAAA